MNLCNPFKDFVHCGQLL